ALNSPSPKTILKKTKKIILNSQSFNVMEVKKNLKIECFNRIYNNFDDKLSDSQMYWAQLAKNPKITNFTEKKSESIYYKKKVQSDSHKLKAMEIIAGTTATTMATQSITPKGLKFDPPFSLLHSQSYAPIRTSLQYSIISRKPRITTRSIADDTTSNTVTKVAAEDPSFAVKKKAADISTELKGTSVFLVGMNNAIKTHLGNFLADALRYYYFDSDSLVFEAAGGESAAKAFRESDEKGYQQAEVIVLDLLGIAVLLFACKLGYFNLDNKVAYIFGDLLLQTEVLKQLSSMGRLVVCAGNGAVQSSANLYEISVIAELAARNFLCLYQLLQTRALLRHGISLWIDVPPGMVARMDHSGFPESEVLPQLFALYKEMRDGYATADATVSLQSNKIYYLIGNGSFFFLTEVASQLGYDDLDAVTTEDMTLEVLKEIEKLTRKKKMMEEAARPF
ncbi:hypothetical protein CICLE_v10017811mg, partial [Citrus x clementina]